MQLLTLAIIVSATLANYLADLRVLPAAARFLPEILSLFVLVYVLAVGAVHRFRLVGARYWIVFAALTAVILAGVVTNEVAPGTFLGGARYYLRAIPMFFLPAVFDFTDAQLLTQLRLLLGISLLQLPVSLYQRHEVTELEHWSGDPVIGTLTISSILSIFLIAGICIAAAMALRGRLGKVMFLALFILFIIPTTINETKSTILLLPLGLLTTLLLGSPPGRRLRNSLSAIGLFAIFGGLYIPVYDYYASLNNPYPYTVENFFSDRKAVEEYVDQDTDLGSRRDAGRWDSLVVPLKTFSSDPVRMMFGVGIGNASISSFGAKYSGEYNGLLGRYTAVSSGGTFLVEIGILGLGMVMLLYWLSLRDAIYVALHDSTLRGALALGWCGVTVVIAIATFYKTLHAFDSLSFLFWYFLGLVAAQRTRLTLQRLPTVMTNASPRALPHR